VVVVVVVVGGSGLESLDIHLVSPPTPPRPPPTRRPPKKLPEMQYFTGQSVRLGLVMRGGWMDGCLWMGWVGRYVVPSGPQWSTALPGVCTVT